MRWCQKRIDSQQGINCNEKEILGQKRNGKKGKKRYILIKRKKEIDRKEKIAEKISNERVGKRREKRVGRREGHEKDMERTSDRSTLHRYYTARNMKKLFSYNLHIIYREQNECRLKQRKNSTVNTLP